MLSRKDLIALNQQFSSGTILNNGSLDFVLHQTYRSKHWFKTMCLLTRAILIDHLFEDGNKRTAAAVIMTYLEAHGRTYHPEGIAKAVLRLTQNNISDVKKIGRIINHATK